ncbi:LysR substrate-binding domain-containing protein [Lysobacter sp. 5GHs7-4]|uniref:LysR substrate-binding domain-containing protein n=1 Tax=Lysobacter sp. 5GHs7-4 TaxID=2904253 RepID=UPI001E40E5DC|nr:LysR substrate-binding domain-containing protein [Lysobacter sp. 5GHs7-4]UHQ24497.1 LysR substrate-binding domain-containing protein [Lysobacter sp. 5GHs7-4]
MALRSDLLPALAAFEAAARHQNFAHAADELHLTASAVSHHVRKLEARLEVSLFQRHARGVSLTAEGRQLADAAGSAMADMEGVLRSLRVARAEHDRVRVTTLHSLAYTWLLPRLPGFVAAHPQLRLSVDTEIALTRFDEGGPDLGIRHGPGHWPGLTAHHLMDDSLFPVAAPSLPGVSELREAAQVARLPLISDHARQGWHDWFRAAEVHGVKLDERYSFSDTTDALQAAVHGLGAALAREQIAVPYLRSGELVRLPGPSVKARWGYYAVYPSHRRLRASARLFLDWLLAVEKE